MLYSKLFIHDACVGANILHVGHLTTRQARATIRSEVNYENMGEC